MGNEAICPVAYDREHGEAKVLLETDELIVRAPFRLRVAFKEMREVDADAQSLRIRWRTHHLQLDLGREAGKWAEKIRNPKSLAEKLGVRDGQKISIAGKFERDFIDELKKRGADVSNRVRSGSDIIFVTVNSPRDFERLSGLRRSLATGGALWMVRPKGNAGVAESDVIHAGRAAALVDVKVARFSDTHSAHKFVTRKKSG